MSFRNLAHAIVIAGLLCASTAGVARASFESWLEGVAREARAKEISERTIREALSGISPHQRVIELDRRQPEGTMTFAQYRSRLVNDRVIRRARALYREHRPLLEEVEARYGVPPQYIVALWGIESRFGENMGGFDVIQSLATLAYDGRRADFFRRELFHALRILDEGHIARPEMRGSWAGAMGQSQFMPSSFNRFAVDGNADGRKDIWATHADIFSSAAHYLHSSGWRPGERWGRPVSLPPQFQASLVGTETRKSLDAWQRLGVRLPDGGDLPQVEGFQASLIRPDGAGTQAFLVYENFRTLLRWNRSHYFATTVGLLADRIPY